MTRRELEQALLQKLSDILADVGWLEEVRPVAAHGSQNLGYDALVRIKTQAGTVLAAAVDIKTDLRPSTFEIWAQKRRVVVSDVETIPVLAVPAMSERLAELCRGKSVSWYDLAGNCRIDVPGQLHIERRGLPPIYSPPRAKANLSSAAAGRVIRVLLSPAHAGLPWTQRGLVQETVWKKELGEDQPIDSMVAQHLFGEDQPVSIGLVNKVLQHLRDEDFIEDSGRKGIRVKDPKGLLEAWNAAYRFERHQRLSCFTLLKPDELEKALKKFRPSTGGMVVYASFSAAERQAPHVRQVKTWLYAAPHCVGNLLAATKANEVDSGENLVVLVPDDIGVLMTYQPFDLQDPRLRPTDPVQTYVDLRHSGGRGEEAAQAILEQVLLPAWKKAGIT